MTNCLHFLVNPAHFQEMPSLDLVVQRYVVDLIGQRYVVLGELVVEVVMLSGVVKEGLSISTLKAALK